MYGAWGGPEHEDIALVPDHVGVEEPRTELGEFQWGFHLDGGPFIARRFRPDELVITDLPPDDEPDRRRFFAARDDEIPRDEKCLECGGELQMVGPAGPLACPACDPELLRKEGE